jgi:hypothetical protein
MDARCASLVVPGACQDGGPRVGPDSDEVIFGSAGGCLAVDGLVFAEVHECPECDCCEGDDVVVAAAVGGEDPAMLGAACNGVPELH